MECPGNARAIVAGECAQPRNDLGDVIGGQLAFVEDDFALEKARFRFASEIQDYLKEVRRVIDCF